MTPRVLLVMGTRPEVIKLAPVYRALKAMPDVATLVCAVTQHDDLLWPFFSEFHIVEDCSAHPDRKTGSLEELTAGALTGITDRLQWAKPDLVLVQGDTTTALCGALAAFYQGIPVGHVEAGLRTNTPREPFPEEMNRRLITRLATLHFAPTWRTHAAVVHEVGVRTAFGSSIPMVHMTGNTVVDVLTEEFHGLLRTREPGLILVTCHRREHLDERLKLLVHAIRRIALQDSPRHVIWPVHPNPAIGDYVRRRFSDLTNVHLVEPMSYREFVHTVSRADVVVTDSGARSRKPRPSGCPR